ncbi:twin-arginine translocation signal domain-containing protein [Streptomyces sp. JH002]|uniref:N,N-dimethylformamidase beta subunit family domain-containing protein n=1 Tax=Streptomyces sp. JH002 TaxID=2763259 RepID=UPI003D8076E7
MTGQEGGLDRRSFLGACAAAGAGMTGACSLWGGQGPDPAGEAAQTGDPGWRITDTGADDAIEGYADRVSVDPGEEFGLYVSTPAPAYRVSAYRIGWYGGAQARRVWRSEPQPGAVQRAPSFFPDTGTVRADWERGLSVSTEEWPEGAYLLRLDAEGGDGGQRYVPLVVRSREAAGRTVLLHAPATWQAYNRWGGYSLYEGKDGGDRTRALVVSFDRPYDKDGAEKFLAYERAAVVLAEQLGLPLAYTTGNDVDRDPEVLKDAASVVILGHDEYMTPAQRDHLTRARDAGTNLAILGANTCFRRIRLDPTPLEPKHTGERRIVACYKSAAARDPHHGHQDALVTTDFRAAPGADPESSLTGVLYEGYPVDAPYVVHRPEHWAFEGTGVRAGDSFDHLVGVEYDRVTPAAPTPEGIEIVAHSPLVCNGTASHHDSAYYTVDSGAGVFAVGTMRWVEALMAGTDENGGNHGMDARTGEFVTKVTENILRTFANGPAAHTHPAHGNVPEVYGDRT